jgi:hypothetical protein
MDAFFVRVHKNFNWFVRNLNWFIRVLNLCLAKLFCQVEPSDIL